MEIHKWFDPSRNEEDPVLGMPTAELLDIDLRAEEEKKRPSKAAAVQAANIIEG
jgi:hypothetical protein